MDEEVQIFHRRCDPGERLLADIRFDEIRAAEEKKRADQRRIEQSVKDVQEELRRRLDESERMARIRRLCGTVGGFGGISDL